MQKSSVTFRNKTKNAKNIWRKRRRISCPNDLWISVCAKTGVYNKSIELIITSISSLISAVNWSYVVFEREINKIYLLEVPAILSRCKLVLSYKNIYLYDVFSSVV